MADPDLLLLGGANPVPLDGTAALALAGSSGVVKGRPVASVSSAAVYIPTIGDAGFDPEFVELGGFQWSGPAAILDVYSYILLAASAAIQFARSAALSAGKPLVSAASVVLGAAAAVVRRQQLGATAAVQLAGSAIMTGRRILTAAAQAVLSGASALARGAPFSSLASVIVNGFAQFSGQQVFSAIAGVTASAISTASAKFRLSAEAALSVVAASAIKRRIFGTGHATIALVTGGVARMWKPLQGVPAILTAGNSAAIARRLMVASAAATVTGASGIIKAKNLSASAAHVAFSRSGALLRTSSLAAQAVVSVGAQALFFVPLSWLVASASAAASRARSSPVGSATLSLFRRTIGAGKSRIRWR